ncbi:hypothetical protein SAMN06264365_10755 [Actinoplanes regularis]|uniref:Uncharacterized protein n=1 Tax=Actinoplanes regularis TaxID=52697 RepID=A0A239A401_9ACTN|nr:hypothetical protein Are01nite_35860 [Actinoplanes regularis]SNR90386.1 hypothetical protein SAMN06264365_10755 [Actinoplanes regularis]
MPGLGRGQCGAPLGKGQTFLHAVLFHPDGEQIVYLLNGETRLLDPLSGRQRRLAAYREGKDAAFNPFRVHPAWNRNRTWLLVFDAGTMVRVLDADGSPPWEVCAGRATATLQLASGAGVWTVGGSSSSACRRTPRMSR